MKTIDKNLDRVQTTYLLTSTSGVFKILTMNEVELLYNSHPKEVYKLKKRLDSVVKIFDSEKKAKKEIMKLDKKYPGLKPAFSKIFKSNDLPSRYIAFDDRLVLSLT
jgi:hypothetical protein